MSAEFRGLGTTAYDLAGSFCKKFGNKWTLHELTRFSMKSRHSKSKFFVLFLFGVTRFDGKSRQFMQSPFISVRHGQSGEVHLFPNFLQKLPAKSCQVMASRAKSAEFCWQMGVYIHTHNSVPVVNVYTTGLLCLYSMDHWYFILKFN